MILKWQTIVQVSISEVSQRFGKQDLQMEGTQHTSQNHRLHFLNGILIKIWILQY